MPRFATIVILYTAVIVFAFVSSSSVVKRKSLYDRYIVNVEGGVLAVSDIPRAIKFYADVMDLIPVSSKKAEQGGVLLGFRATSRQNFYVSLIPGEEQKPLGAQTVILRVRNGFENIHQEIKSRLKNMVYGASMTDYRESIERMPAGSLSSIVEFSWGSEFVVKDLDQNVFIFYKARKILGSRY
ncbi:MAG: hypothetical protein KDD66_12750 [Bdellovibrionales bacterium]|nr:hypothetical protein [Bdellovibrionales bacterium]